MWHCTMYTKTCEGACVCICKHMFMCINTQTDTHTDTYTDMH